MNKKHLVLFSGAGMSAESGLKTFRDYDGLWENYSIEDVATPEAWRKDKNLVLNFYNMRREQLLKAKPNKAHLLVASLEQDFKVSIITQNIDDLHERSGSEKVIHLHGELRKVQSERFPELVYNWETPKIKLGDVCEKGHQLRPHVVWFGEAVPKMDEAYEVVQSANIFVVIGTSLNVYPAAGIVNYVPDGCEKYLIDPNPPISNLHNDFTVLKATAEEGMTTLVEKLRT